MGFWGEKMKETPGCDQSEITVVYNEKKFNNFKNTILFLVE